LFQEAIVGRSYAFWVSEYPRLQQTVAPALDGISLPEFYAAWVKTQPSLIRVEADALTYPLHIIIRYEIEKAIFNDDLPVEALPQLWRDKYREYLGIDVPDDLTGILQDIHWSGGSFGYFPSYALGHFYAAQMRHAMMAEFNVDDVLQSGDYQLLFDWRKEHVWQYGASKTPQEILQLATGESLNVQYWLDFQRDIYQSI
jgi:carboxypeptidase Taq